MIPWIARLDLYEASEVPTTSDISVELSIGSFQEMAKKSKTNVLPLFLSLLPF
jgi:fatty acid-binding protein DegV